MEKRSLVLLGSTGSIGRQTLDVAEKAGYRPDVLAAHSNVQALEAQIRQYAPHTAVMYDESAAADLRVRVADLPVKVLSGMDGLCAAAADPDADLVLNAVVGMVGLQPTLAAIGAGHDVALANKETLVAGGAAVMAAAKRQGVRILPVDSEHSAIFQCLQGAPRNGAVRRLILTASGGPFFGYTAAQLEDVTPAQALKHPNWSMGAKVTIDSATMMNKGLELIEARWLFDMTPERIDVVVHRESVVHSLVEYDDGGVIAQLGDPDMRLPIQYALTWPDRLPCPVKTLDLAAWGKLTFFAPDDTAFPNLSSARKALVKGGLYTAAMNAVNEVAVAQFLGGKIGFADISRMVGAVLDWDIPAGDSVEEILTVDAECRARALSLCK